MLFWESKIKFGQKFFAFSKICTPVHLWLVSFEKYLKSIAIW